MMIVPIHPSPIAAIKMPSPPGMLVDLRSTIGGAIRGERLSKYRFGTRPPPPGSTDRSMQILGQGDGTLAH
jgi:hypothetical protein